MRVGMMRGRSRMGVVGTGGWAFCGGELRGAFGMHALELFTSSEKTWIQKLYVHLSCKSRLPRKIHM